ncbi:zinc-binding dehydrogenase [Nocardioides albus]|uniref:alcohol dehydrogenase n=1 Tax=Nocardioides albus TaxID=1841 RepID=A0A7W5FAN8_9ACTN|nr:zinc-binding dehydrogenase [Nocardioides albus]MBB3091345.1 putative phosphonate catabolism associated alcohol dehydrogenase [Nocardioides albus]GGU39841.1 alcohol dehydrogenase [Nocardioides albus]
MARSARVAVWRGGAEVTSETVPLPSPGQGETLVEIDLATVCGSDHHTVSGRRPGACPSVLGHEGVGRIAGTGQRVVWGVTVSCGACDRCLRGLTAKCRRVRKLGHERYEPGWPLSGTYATHVLLPAGTAVVPVPDTLTDEVAAPAGCATATVMAALERAGSLNGRRVLIVGAGMLGLTAVAAAAGAGAAEIVVSDVEPARLELAVDFGATSTLPAAQTLPTVDVALDFSGAAPAIEEALAALDIGGSLLLVGSVSPGPAIRLDPEDVVRGWRSVSGVHNYEPRHLEQAVAFLAASTRPWADLVEAPVGLDRVGSLLTGELGRPRASVRPANN